MAWIRIILDVVAAYFIGSVAGVLFGILFFVVAMGLEVLRTAQSVNRSKRSINAAVLRDRQFYRAR